jgi:hypothetical protein
VERFGFALFALYLSACGSSSPASSGGASAGASSSDGGAGAGAGDPLGSAGMNVAGASSGGASNGGASNGGASNGGMAAILRGSIVPLYSYPDAPAWQAIIAAKALHPKVTVIAIVNPDNGPGASIDATFTKGIAALVAASIVPIGYISTSYTARGEPTVKGNIDRWHTQYAAVQGIFFDEQSNKVGDEQFYRDVSQYAKAQGFTLTVGNPGSDVPSSYLDTVDVMLAYEDSGTPPLASLTKYAAQRSHFGIIPYGTALDPVYVKAASSSVAYVYITDDTLPNPWDTLPSSFASLLNALE